MGWSEKKPQKKQDAICTLPQAGQASGEHKKDHIHIYIAQITYLQDVGIILPSIN